MANFELTIHAEKVAVERCIDPVWIERTISKPELRLPDPDDPALVRLYRRIEERQNRVLRVVVNPSVDPIRVISVFFDRSMRDGL